MKKSGTKILLFMLILLMMFSVLSLPMVALAAERVTSTREDISVITGTSGAANYFKEDTYYDLPKIDTTPLTYEFEVAVPKDGITGSVLGGVILGNYGLDGKRCISIEIHQYGKVRFYTNTSSGNVDIKFSNQTIDVRKGTTVHIAITIDVTAGTATLYVNGTKADTQTNSKLKNLPKASDFPFNFRIGGDHRSGNNHHFEGAVDSVALYSDIRTPQEIAEDAKKAKSWSSETDNLIAAYDLTKQGETALKDYSGNGYTLTYTNGSGALLKNYGTYNVEQKLQGNPETLEAWVFLPDFYSGRGGTIFGNDDNSKSTSPDIAFEIEYDGHPRFYYATENGSAVHEFGKVDIRTGKWQHVTIVHDVATKEARCYVNGVLAETLAYTETMGNDNGGKQTPVEAYHSNITDGLYALGGNNQKGNPQFFKGFIKEVRVYSDVRTASEIAADYSGSIDTSDSGLMAYYLISEENLYNDIEDLSGNGYTAKYNQLMFDTTEPLTDYAYSLAVVGDTQTITNHNSAKLKDLYQWIVDNKDARNIQYVIGLGDITERGDRNGSTYTDEETARKQWQAAKDAITLMDGNVPYSLIRGAGHDGLDFFDEYFAGHSAYTDNIAGYYTEGSVENVYHTFRVGAIDYMILCLEFGAKDDVLAWADKVVAAHPYHRVIVTTHGYLEKDGSFLEGHETYAPSRYDPESNDGDEIWDKFVRKHANIFMVMSGHMSANDVIVSEMVGDNGNVVKQLLINPQSMDSSSSLKGMVAMLYFSADGTEVQVEYYSTLTKMWRPKSTFSVSYVVNDEELQTPYGKIPVDYADVDKYPVIVFNTETGEAVMATSNLSGENNAIGYCAANGGKHAIYIRKNVNSNATNWNIGTLNGELTIDLNGNTVTVNTGVFLEFQGRSVTSSVVKVTNGSIVMGDAATGFIGIGGKWGNGKKTNNITVENVVFENLRGGLVFETFGEAVITTSTISFKDCTFDIDENTANKLIALGSHGTNTRANITFESGKFIFNGSYSGIYTTGGINYKNVYFDKNANGEYPTVKVIVGDTVPADGFFTKSGEELDVIGGNGDYTIGICSHVYDNDYDADCNNCGEIREVEIPVTVVAEGKCGVNTTWVLTSDGILAISGNGDTEDYLVSITTEQPYRAYQDMITKVVIEEGVTSIGRGAFYGFTAITEVVLPESLIAIHEYAFFGCTGIKTITIPENTFYIGMYAFRKSGLTEMTFANAEGWKFADGTALDVTNVKAFTTEFTYKQTCMRPVYEDGEVIANGVFGNKDQFTWTLTSTGLLTVSGTGNMPKFNVNTTPWYGYRGAIRSVVIEEGITSVGRCSFHTCRAITSVTLPESLETIAEYAFYNCQFLTEATIPANVTRIEIYAFRKCFALKNVEFALNYGWSANGEKISATELNSNAADMLTLVNYTKLWTRDVNAEEEILDPNYVTGGACNTTVKWSLTYTDDTKMKLTISGTGAMPKFETAGTPWYGYLNDIVEVEVCEGITEIGRCSFYGLKFVKVATIANTVTAINDYAFNGCFSLKTIEIPESVTYIADTAFTKTGLSEIPTV